ncbi:MAG: hypothetical protein ACFE0I_08545 [Elainellaceae cyanobacterium]
MQVFGLSTGLRSAEVEDCAYANLAILQFQLTGVALNLYEPFAASRLRREQDAQFD